MYWNIRIFKHSVGIDQDDKEIFYYAAHETYYDKKDKIESYTKDPIDLRADSVDELIDYVQMILDDLKKTRHQIFDYED